MKMTVSIWGAVKAGNYWPVHCLIVFWGPLVHG